VDDLTSVPPDLPRPLDDGRASGLLGRHVPAIPLSDSRGDQVRLDDRQAPTTVVFAYPLIADPRKGPPGGLVEWTRIPGARGCTAEACGYRDRYEGFEEIGARLFGLSTQDPAWQHEASDRLGLPYELLADRGLAFSRALGLPRWRYRGRTYLKRLTFVIKEGKIVWVEYPVFPPEADAERVLHWLRAA
jgi:peroxiredoxin